MAIDDRLGSRWMKAQAARNGLDSKVPRSKVQGPRSKIQGPKVAGGGFACAFRFGFGLSLFDFSSRAMRTRDANHGDQIRDPEAIKRISKATPMAPRLDSQKSSHIRPT